MTNDIKKSRAKKRIVIDSIIVFFIALTPFLYKIYDYLPVNDPEATVSFLGLTIGSNGFADVSTYVWFLSVKIIPFILLIIWFFTSRDWWYHILLIPIAMYAFQLFEAFYSENDYVDTENIWWLLPVCMVIIPIVYFIRIKLYDKYVHGIDLEAMESELARTKTKENVIQETESEVKESSEVKKEEFIGYPTLTETINSKLSTNNIERVIKRLQNTLKSWLNFKF